MDNKKEKKLDTKNVKEFDISQLKRNDEEEAKPKVPNDKFLKDGLFGLDGLIEDTKKKSLEFVGKVKEQEFDEGFEEEENNNIDTGVKAEETQGEFKDIKDTREKVIKVAAQEYKEDESFNNVHEVESKPSDDSEKKEEIDPEDKPSNDPSVTKSLFDDLDDEDKDEDKEEDAEKQKKEENEQLKEMQKSIKEKIKPITNVIDLSTFKISKTPISMNNALSVTSSKHCTDWILPATGTTISLFDFSADEIERLNLQQSSQNRFNALTTVWKLIYEHVNFHSTEKPLFEQWVQTINFYDMNHIYFGIFKASFDKKIVFPYQCPKCKHVFMKEISFDDLVKYKNVNVKNEATRLLETVNFNPNKYEVELVQVSDNVVMGLKEPSIYDVIFANARLEDKFTTKYFSLMEIISFIDNIYIINRTDSTLVPINLVYYKDPVKTLKAKIRKFAGIINTLDSDQYYFLNSYITKISEKHDTINYVLPAAQCDKCKVKIDEKIDTAENLLFTRHRLMSLVTLPTE